MRWHTVRALPVLLVVSPLLACTGGGDDSSVAPPAMPDASLDAQTVTVHALDCAPDSGDWPMYGQNVCNTRAGAGSDPITTKTVSKLKVKWTYKAAGDISATPAVVDGQLYVPDWGGMLNRIDANTGNVVWSKAVGDILGLSADGGTPSDAETSADGAPLDTSGTRAYASPVSRTTPIVAGSNVIFTMGSAQASATIAAVDKDTAALKWRTSLESHPTALITSSPAIDGDTIYIGVSSGEEVAAGLISGYPCCSFRGSVVALSATTGAIKWKTYMIEDSVYYGSDHKTLSGYSGVAIWSGTPTVDRKRGTVYATTGNNYSTPTGATNPPPAGDHVESVVALDLSTGAIKWSSRMVDEKKGDVWTFSNFSGPDYDLGCPANLFQVALEGGVQDVVGVGQKSGVYWAVNADNGKVLWKNQVGPGGHLGGIHWGAAVDSDHVYVGVNDETGTAYTMGGKGSQAGKKTSVGSWAALNVATGKTEWQVANPSMTAPLNGGSVNGPVAVVNGVVFGGSMDAKGTMYAMDGATGHILWSFESGATVYSGPAIVNGVVYWGVGYPSSRLGLGSSGTTQLYAFDLGN
jgi:polyvinyl alcohol dehydrogenase (cytochrome)